MSERWLHLLAVLQTAHEHLANDVGFLAANGSGEERSRSRSAWAAPLPLGLDASLLLPLAETPTLTLSIDFPLPAYRQDRADCAACAVPSSGANVSGSRGKVRKPNPHW